MKVSRDSKHIIILVVIGILGVHPTYTTLTTRKTLTLLGVLQYLHVSRFKIAALKKRWHFGKDRPPGTCEEQWLAPSVARCHWKPIPSKVVGTITSLLQSRWAMLINWNIHLFTLKPSTPPAPFSGWGKGLKLEFRGHDGQCIWLTCYAVMQIAGQHYTTHQCATKLPASAGCPRNPICLCWCT